MVQQRRYRLGTCQERRFSGPMADGLDQELWRRDPGCWRSPGAVTAEERRSTACGRVAVAVGSTADERHGRVPLS